MAGQGIQNIIVLSELAFTCRDARYPILMSNWVVGCGPSGRVDRAFSLATKQVARFTVKQETVGMGFFPFMGSHGRLSLQKQKLEKSKRILASMIAPPISDQDRVAYLGKEFVALRQAGQTYRQAAQPRAWYPPALFDSGVAWVENDGQRGEDIWMWKHEHSPKRIAGGKMPQRHVVGSGPYVAWVEDQRIVIFDSRTEEQDAIEAQVVDRISLTDKTVCWSQWNQRDIDVYCSDGFALNRPGHQVWPMRQGKWLLFRDLGRKTPILMEIP